MTIIADFLAGSLLSLLLPVALLIALVVWYIWFIKRVPETAEADVPPASSAAGHPSAANPGSGVSAADPSNRPPDG